MVKPVTDEGDRDPSVATQLLKPTFAVIAVAALAGLLISQTSGVFAATGIGIEIFLASLASGAALGFLFAVPRVLSQGAAKPPEDGREARSRFLQSNTNLERISDWLTTMLVGVGISQLHRVNDALLGFRRYIAETALVFDGTAGALPAVAPLLLITGALTGFIVMYLHTRIDLVRFFDEVEGVLSGEARRAVVGAARSTEADGSPLLADIERSSSVTIDNALDVMFDLLYKPDGYRKVIELAAQLSNSPATKRAAYWYYLAAAFGQQLKHARANDDSELAISARDNAIDCIRRAIKIDPSYRARFWLISDPNSTDDDLSELRDDTEFLSLVGKEAKGDRKSA